MFSFRLPFYDGPIILSDDLKPLITVLWLLGMSQAINLIDGLDGLAAGIVAIGALAFFLYSQKLTDLGLLDSGNVGPLLAIIAVGAVRRLPAAQLQPGAHHHGRRRSVAARSAAGRVDERRRWPRRLLDDEFIGQTYFFLAPLVIPLLILGVPILDTLFAIIRRATGRKALADADKGHLHHRLMNLGHGHRRSVVILWTWTALLSGFVLYPDADRLEPDVPAVRHGGPGDRALHDPAPERAGPPPGRHRGRARGDGRPRRRGERRGQRTALHGIRSGDDANDRDRSAAPCERARRRSATRAERIAEILGIGSDAGLPTAGLDH